MKQDDVENEALLKEDEASETDGDSLHPSPFHRERTWIKLFLVLLFFFAIILLTIIAIATQYLPSNKNTSDFDAAAKGCGTSPEEAAAAGCIFDLMNYGWTPPACYDHELSNSSLSSGPWKWYYDKNATQPIEQDVIEKGQEMHVWTEHHFHMAHCLYAFKIIHKATMTGQSVPKELIGWHHTMHCDDMLGQREGKSASKISVRVRMIFNPCVKLGSEKFEQDV